MDTQPEDLSDQIEMYDLENATHLEKVQLAQECLRVAYGLLKEVAKDTKDENNKAYIVDHLRMLIDSGHGFCSRDSNLEDWIAKLEEEEEEEHEIERAEREAWDKNP